MNDNGLNLLENLDYSVVQQCMHCGMCLPTCPTYDATLLERSSPRGRIAMMRAIADGDLQASKVFAEEMYSVWGVWLVRRLARQASIMRRSSKMRVPRSNGKACYTAQCAILSGVGPLGGSLPSARVCTGWDGHCASFSAAVCKHSYARAACCG